MRVLVVDDERGLTEGLRRGIEAEGFAVDVAYDGVDGLWMATERPYDVIVLDVMLPGLSGHQVCAALRGDRIWTPILMLTAVVEDEVKALDSGADDYLTKPFSYAVLIARLRALIRRGTPERPVILEVGALSLDPAARRAWKDGCEIACTAREFALLEYLMRHPGQTLTKRNVLEHVWDDRFEGDPNIVEVYVRRLRVRLGTEVIETLRGAGYRLCAPG